MTPEPGNHSAKTDNAGAPATRSTTRHGLGFLVSGGIAFATDALVLEVLIRFAGMHPLTARLFAIAAAMVVGWLCHRVMTFAVDATPSVREFLRYILSASSAAVLNYAVYAALILLSSISPFSALVASSVVAAFYSYFSMKYFVFQQPATDAARRKTDG